MVGNSFLSAWIQHPYSVCAVFYGYKSHFMLTVLTKDWQVKFPSNTINLTLNMILKSLEPWCHKLNKHVKYKIRHFIVCGCNEKMFLHYFVCSKMWILIWLQPWQVKGHFCIQRSPSTVNHCVEMLHVNFIDSQRSYSLLVNYLHLSTLSSVIASPES